LAISRQRKEELVSHYVDWLNRSQLLVLTEYAGMDMKQIDGLRGKVREAGGEFHIIKNKLGLVAFQQAGMEVPQNLLDGSTAVIFAFRDAPEMSKIISDYVRTSDFVKIKGGYLDKHPISANGVKALADLPPLPVMRAQLLGVLMAPASRLVRTLAEPARQLAAVLKAHADQNATPATA